MLFLPKPRLGLGKGLVISRPLDDSAMFRAGIELAMMNSIDSAGSEVLCRSAVFEFCCLLCWTLGLMTSVSTNSMESSGSCGRWRALLAAVPENPTNSIESSPTVSLRLS